MKKTFGKIALDDNYWWLDGKRCTRDESAVLDAACMLPCFPDIAAGYIIAVIIALGHRWETLWMDRCDSEDAASYVRDTYKRVP